MARVKALMLGVDSLSYKFFMKCSSKSLLTLLDTTFRGVTENKDLHDPVSAWLTVLSGREVRAGGFLSSASAEDYPLLRDTGATPVNLPITNPTFGRASMSVGQEVPPEAEISRVVEEVLEALDEGPVVAAITALERFPSGDPCPLYRAIDDAVRRLVMASDEFIVFSPYGPRLPRGGYDPYGVYLASRPRPAEHETVKLWQLAAIFRAMAGV